MSAARTRLLLVDTGEGVLSETTTGALPALFTPRDLLVVNDAATLPASLRARTEGGAPVEIRLLEGPYASITRAVLFGAGDHRTPTEAREAPPVLAAGEALLLAGGTRLAVNAVSELSPRLVDLAWPGDADARFALLYREGAPVQYSHAREKLALWDVQTSFAGRPWAAEMPSAARPLLGSMMVEFRKRGVPMVAVTHAAGLSATGDPPLDAALPLPERYDIPEATAEAIAGTRAGGGRVVAIGTSVVRALEDSAARWGRVRAGEAIAHHVLDVTTPPRVVSGLLTGIHVPGESHYRLLEAFAPGALLERASSLVRKGHYRLHEFGDAALFLPGLPFG